MKITKQDVVNLWSSFESINDQKKNVLFSYFVAKNKIAIKSEVDAIKEAQTPSEAFKAFEEKRVKLVNELADKDPATDQPLIAGNQYVIIENAVEFGKGMDKLRETFGTAIADREKQMTDLSTILQEEVEFEGNKIKLENLPDQIEPMIIECFLNADLIIEE